MGEMLLNGRLYGASGIRELTQAQYDALPSSKLTDGILYCIKDTGIVEGDKYAPIIYSLEEREVGVWTDGRPLYQRTFSGSLTPSASSDIIFNLSTYNIGEIIQADGYIKRASTYGYCLQIGSYLNGNHTSAWYKSGDGSFMIYHAPASEYDTYVVTLQYTKTTDVPGSGTWGTDGVPMVHYDGTERIIGTWFGETLYQKSYIFNNYALVAGQNLIDLPILRDIDVIVNSIIIMSNSAHTNFRALNGYDLASSHSNSLYYVLHKQVAESSLQYKLELFTSASWATPNIYVTLQYTKSS